MLDCDPPSSAVISLRNSSSVCRLSALIYCVIALLPSTDCSYDYQRIYDSMQKPAFVFDGRNILDHDELKAVGFRVYGIGKPNGESRGL